MCKKISVTLLVVFLCFMSYIPETTLAQEMKSKGDDSINESNLAINEDGSELSIPEEENTMTEELLENTSLKLEEIMVNLCQETRPIEAMINSSEYIKHIIEGNLSEKELYQFIQFYPYLVLSDLVNDLMPDNGRYEQDELEEAIDIFHSLILQSMEKSILSEEDREAMYQNWNKELFELLEVSMTHSTDDVYSEINRQDADITSYKAYMQSSAQFDIDIFLELMDNMRDALNEETLKEAQAVVIKYIKELYGYSEAAELDTLKETKAVLAGTTANVRAEYNLHGKDYGWKGWRGGSDSGTESEKDQVEALQIDIKGDSGLGITYQTHIQNKGWMNWTSTRETSGTVQSSLRLEAFRAKLTGANASAYDLYYRAYCEELGWLGWAKNGQTAGTIQLSSAMYGMQILVVPAGMSAPGATSGSLRTDAVARVGNTYYSTFDGAFAALANGGTMYVIKNCIAGHNVTTKSFTILPEEQNVVVTASSSLGIEPAGMIAVPNGTPAGTTGTWTFSGNNGFTLTLDGNRKYSSGILSVLCSITLNLKDGVRLQNGMANGIWNSLGTTNVYRDVMIFNNLDAGIASQGTVNLYGGQIYNNSTNGIRAHTIKMTDGHVYRNGTSGLEAQGVDNNTAITVSGGEIYSNVLDGITAYAANGVCTTKITGGRIYSNYMAGIRSQVPSGTLHISGEAEIAQNLSGVITVSDTYLSGGTIHGNRNSGVSTSKSLTMTGGSIYSNKSIQNGGGIYNSGKFLLSGGEILSNNAINGGGIYNDASGEIRVSGGSVSENQGSFGEGVYQNGIMVMNGSAVIQHNNDIYLPEVGKMVLVEGALASEQAARITPSAYTLGRVCVRNVYADAKGSSIYQKFLLTPNTYYLLRPGDYQSAAAKTSTADVAISRTYSVHYEKNYNDSDIQIPEDTSKYWFETGKVSVQIPVFGIIKFKGWGEHETANTPIFQPGDDISASLNQDISLFAIWETQIKITYMGEYADSGVSRSEYLSLEQSKANEGYEVRKNATYTKFLRNGYAFAGWSDNAKKTNIKDIQYPENKMNKIGFDELYMMAKAQSNELSDYTEIPEAVLYDVWDQAPELSAEEVLEFYEGTVVSKEMLLTNIKAVDQEDGDITENIRIIRIEYSQKGYHGSSGPQIDVQVWEDDMPVDFVLDTWFMKLIKDDSPVVHQITYAVTDSAGTEVRLEGQVKVKYNEFPVIHGEDRYFTLEEARRGDVTEELLVRNALECGRLKVTDEEDDHLFPGTISQKIELLDFYPEEFTSFEQSGYVVLTYSVKDSMGPDEKGKETLAQFIVYVVKDGEIIRPESKSYVRFINEENYEKNAYVDEKYISEEDKLYANQNGGLDLDSKWYKIPEYRSVLSAIWGQNKNAEAVWRFTCEEIKAVKQFIEVHGIGNSQEEDALSKFAEKYRNSDL
jgi:uncharacterized protein YjdB